jgi:hypothetical protein
MALTASSVFYPASFAACPHSHRIAMADTLHELQRFYIAADYGAIEKLTQQNYFSWKQSMMVYLRSLLLLDIIVEGTRGPLPANASRERHEHTKKCGRCGILFFPREDLRRSNDCNAQKGRTDLRFYR